MFYVIGIKPFLCLEYFLLTICIFVQICTAVYFATAPYHLILRASISRFPLQITFFYLFKRSLKIAHIQTVCAYNAAKLFSKSILW